MQKYKINLFGLSEYKHQILLALLEKEPRTISEIMRHLNISYKETHRHVAELTKNGIIQRNRNNKEKHAPVYISLTENGRKVAELRKIEQSILGEEGKKEMDDEITQLLNETWEKIKQKQSTKTPDETQK
jgi:DNA-binding MarR family transcriptional regulator